MTTATVKPSKSLSRAEYSRLTRDEKRELSKERMKAASETFERALTEMVESKRFAEYLQAASRCHSYTLKNTLWVAAQRGGDLTGPIASYNTWKKLGYQVRKGESGALVWVPTPVKLNPSDNPDDEEKTILRFRTGRVFTLDQVDPIDGKALPVTPPEPEPITGESHRPLISLLESYAHKRGYRIRHLKPEEQPDVAGYLDRTGMVIAYRPEQPANSLVRTLIHELIHSLGAGYDRYGRSRAETITDAATFLCCRMVGLDVKETSATYVAGWGNGNVKTILKDLTVINNLANQLIDETGLDRHLALSPAERFLHDERTGRAAKQP